MYAKELSGIFKKFNESSYKLGSTIYSLREKHNQASKERSEHPVLMLPCQFGSMI